MKKFKTIKINTETYAKLAFLKGWIGANKNHSVGLDEAIQAGIESLRREDERLNRALDEAIQDEVEYA